MRIALAALFLALQASCATYPKHTEPEPLGPPRSGALVDASAVRLLVAPLPRSERCVANYYHRLALRPSELSGPADMERKEAPARTLGDVRSANVILTAEDADALERAWWRPTDWPPTSLLDCSNKGLAYARVVQQREAEDIAQTRPLLERALDDLRARAAAGGADEIADVRCYIVANTINVTPRRLWCEGVARKRA
jgi:hypothetical protein